MAEFLCNPDQLRHMDIYDAKRSVIKTVVSLISLKILHIAVFPTTFFHQIVRLFFPVCRNLLRINEISHQTGYSSVLIRRPFRRIDLSRLALAYASVRHIPILFSILQQCILFFPVFFTIQMPSHVFICPAKNLIHGRKTIIIHERLACAKESALSVLPEHRQRYMTH